MLWLRVVLRRLTSTPESPSDRASITQQNLTMTPTSVGNFRSSKMVCCPMKSPLALQWRSTRRLYVSDTSTGCSNMIALDHLHDGQRGENVYQSPARLTTRLIRRWTVDHDVYLAASCLFTALRSGSVFISIPRIGMPRFVFDANAAGVNRRLTGTFHIRKEVTHRLFMFRRLSLFHLSILYLLHSIV